MQVWKDIVGYEGLYQVSNYGNIKTIGRWYYSGRNNATKKWNKEKILSPKVDKDGYLQVVLSKNGIRTYYRVHRLVLQTFNPIDEYCEFEVNHINGCKHDNHLYNLEWVTRSENTIHSLYILNNYDNLNMDGLNKPMKVHQYSPTYELVQTYKSMREVEQVINISRNTLNKYNDNGLLYKGYYWEVVK